MGMMALTNRIWASKIITFEYAIQPLNILKQILSMFMSIDTSDQLLNLKGLSVFILDKNSNELPDSLRVLSIIQQQNKSEMAGEWQEPKKVLISLGKLLFPLLALFMH